MAMDINHQRHILNADILQLIRERRMALDNHNDLLKAKELLREEFGDNWLTIAQMIGTEDLRMRVGKELTSFMAFPDRGSGGSNKWRGNCSPEVVSAVIRYIQSCKQYSKKDMESFTLIDPMSGSGTSHAAAQKAGIQSILYDLNPKPPAGQGDWNALKDEVDDSADLIFFHPPYHSIIKYSGYMWGKPHPDDLSRCDNYSEFIDKLNFIIKKLFMALRKDGRLAVLVGDIRSNGNFYSMQRDLIDIGKLEASITKAQFNCVSDNRTYAKPFVPIVTESLLIFHKENSLFFNFSGKRAGRFDIGARDCEALTWHHLIRLTFESKGGSASLQELYSILEDHPKSQENTHYKERIRATIYEHKAQYISCGDGVYKLSYAVA